MRLRQHNDRLKIEHSIIDGVREMLDRLLSNKWARSVRGRSFRGKRRLLPPADNGRRIPAVSWLGRGRTSRGEMPKRSAITRRPTRASTLLHEMPCPPTSMPRALAATARPRPWFRPPPFRPPRPTSRPIRLRWASLGTLPSRPVRPHRCMLTSRRTMPLRQTTSRSAVLIWFRLRPFRG